MIDISKINPGDFVTVRAEVKHVGVNVNLGVFFVSPRNFTWIPLEIITGHEPAPVPLKIGDAVAYDGRRYTIIGLYRDQAWLEHLEEAWCFVNISQLQRVEP